MTNEQKKALLSALVEAVKEGGRLALSLFIGFVLDSLVAYFTKTAPTGQWMTGIAMSIRIADLFWHNYRNDTTRNTTGKPLGLFPF